MTRKDFIELATYLSEAWRGFFTASEIRENANDYFTEYQTEKTTGEKSDILTDLLEQMQDDVNEIGLNNIESIERRTYNAIMAIRA